MKTRARKARTALPCAALAAMLGSITLTTGCMTSSVPVEQASSQTLIDTHWRLMQIGAEIIDNPAAERDLHVVLRSTNLLVSGYSGCNRMSGHYAVNGDALKFDQMGGTRMFCEGRMDLEQKFLIMFEAVTAWKITGRTLQLLDANGKAVGTFEAPSP
ncbi:MAG: META domain-containing protein [Pseudomonadota bacterium]